MGSIQKYRAQEQGLRLHGKISRCYASGLYLQAQLIVSHKVYMSLKVYCVPRLIYMLHV
jgi:hypothetical protein